MQPTTSLASYAIRVWNIDEREADPISSFADDSDLFDFLNDFFVGLKTKVAHDASVQQVLRVKTLNVVGRQLSGIIETGEYGSESELWDVKKASLAHMRKTTEADMIPFYFLVDLPKGPDEGLLVLERRGMSGIRQVLYHAVSSEFDHKFKDHRLRFDPLVQGKELEKYVKGKIESIRFVRFDIPKDISDAFASGHKEVKGRVELVVHAQRGKSLPLNDMLSRFLRGGTKVGELIALDETKFKYENIKMQSRVGRSRRTIDLARTKHLRSYHDISDTVQFDPKSGNPKFDSIHGLATALAEQLKSQMYKKNGNE
jgi:hypothetical protein